MGFYGNITNSAKTNMTFDKKYSSRYEMDKNVESDGIYAGRYVLVEYGLSWSTAVYSSDENDNNSDENILYYKWENDLYKDSTYTQKVILDPEKIEIFFVVEYKTDSEKRSRSELWVNYKTGRLERVIDKISDDSADSNYVANFNIDKKIYGDGRGYDSTVWTKVFDKNGKPQYVMIAELNSVVPTFSLTVDAPSDKPNAPYFDELGSNVHYNMHIRNPWGYKVGTIEFNEAGFDSKNRVIVENPQDYITITDDFSNPKNSYNGKEEKDVKKLSINLPSIGNMVAKGWDVIHGEDRDDSPATSLQGRLDFFTNKGGNGIKLNEIPVQSQDGYLVGATIGGDDWISCVVDSTKTEDNKIKITHKFTSGSTTESKANKNFNERTKDEIEYTGDNHGIGDSINLYTPEVDGKGHVIGRNIETVTLPYGYKTFIGDNNTKTSANNTQDSINVNGDNWIKVNISEDKIALTHKTPVTGTAITTNNETPSFGETFTIKDYHFDSNGHKFKETTHTVKIPDLILTNDTNGNVVTSITLSETDKTFTEIKANIGTLSLTGYDKTKKDDSDLEPTDDLNTAFVKLQNQIHGEEEARAAAINNLNYSDTESTTTKVVTKVTQDNGKVSVIHTNVGNLLRVTGHDDNNNEITATINDSFANLQTQINNIIGSGDIADNFDTIKEIADWLKKNDSEADGIIDSIATLNGNEETSGSVQNQIKTAIEGLDSEKVATAGNYISGIHIVDGKISTIDESKLPISNVQADWNATEGSSVILNKPTDLIKENDIIDVIRTSTEFDYETKEVINEETGESTVEITKITIDGLIEVILDLQDRVKKLEEDYSKIINSDNQPEEENPETTE